MKFWKTFFICLFLVITCITFNACSCSRAKPEVSIDLDGDGIISDWETIFENVGASDRIIPSTTQLTEISSLEDLKSINDNVNESKNYILTKNIDCKGETLSINLGTSVLYGNNKVIKNFKLGSCNFETSEDQTIDANIYGLFYNGAGIFDLRVFLGYQNISINNTKTYSSASTFVNIANLENIIIKGKIDFNRLRTEGLNPINYVDLSIVYNNVNNIIDDSFVKDTFIREIQVIGQINYGEQGDTGQTRLRLGSVSSAINDNSTLYNASSDVDISASTGGYLVVGGIVGENNDMVTTCEYNGTISSNNIPNWDNKIGGIVGLNGRDGEIKNATCNGNISYTTEIETSDKYDLNIGGISGSNYGVVEYCVNNSTINVSKANKAQIGGISGYSEDGIFSNIINRGKIDCKNITDLYIAEMVGITKNGYFETIIDNTTISVDNHEINSNVKLGMLTIFEDVSLLFSPDNEYNALYTPSFSGILLAGTVNVNMKPQTTNSNIFVYNLGLRNKYEAYVRDESGYPITKPVLDGNGEPVLDENNDPLYEYETITYLPDVYSKLFVLETYSLKKYSTNDNSSPQDVLDITYAKDNSNANLVSSCSSSRLQVNFFVRDLGFKYGVNHNEIDLSEIDLMKIKFNLDENKSTTKYFEEKSYNGELVSFDKFIENACTYDKNDEMYSLLNSLILSDSTSLYIPLKISGKFAITSETDLPNSDSSDDMSDEEIDTSITLQKNFANNINIIIKNMLNVSSTIIELTDKKTDIQDSFDLNAIVKYERLRFRDSNYIYELTFNVSQLVEDSDKTDEEIKSNSYIVYLQYVKTNRY